MISIIQVIIVLFALFAWSRILLRFRRSKESPGQLVLWTIVWLSIIFVAIYPGIAGIISQLVGVESGISLAVYISIIVLLYLVYRLYVRADHQQQEITGLVRSIAINNAKRPKKRQK